MTCRLLYRACRRVAFTSRPLSGDSPQAAFASCLLSGASRQGFLGAAGGVAEFSTGKKFGNFTELSEDEGNEKQKAEMQQTGRQQAERQTKPSSLGDDSKEKESSGGTDSDTPNPFSAIKQMLNLMAEAEEKSKAKVSSKIIWFDESSDSFVVQEKSSFKDQQPLYSEWLSESFLHEKYASKPQQQPIVSKPSVVKKPSALSDIMNELKRVAKPYPNLAIPRENLNREYLGQAVPMFQSVSTKRSSGDLLCDLRVDVWPIPDYCMLHGIWPCYIHESGWIVYLTPDNTIEDALAVGKEEVEKEILNLDPKIKETLHKIWKSYSGFVRYKKDAEGRDVSFWAYEKVVHCWDDAGLPRGEYFNTIAKVGDAVRSTLLRWMVKSDVRPNHFYDSAAWGEEMKNLYDADVHLVMKKDCNDPEATRITYLEGMSLLMKIDNDAGVSLMDYPRPPSRSSAEQGKFFLCDTLPFPFPCF